MRTTKLQRFAVFAGFVLVVGGVATVLGQETFQALVQRLQKEKPEFAQRQEQLLDQRYDLADRPAQGVTMSRNKPIQEGVRVRLRSEVTWEQLAALTPDEIKNRSLWPAGFY